MEQYIIKKFDMLYEANKFILKNELKEYELIKFYNAEFMKDEFILKYKENNNE